MPEPPVLEQSLKPQFMAAKETPQQIGQNQDQRFTVFKAIINNAYQDNPKNFNLQLMHAIASGKTDLILPNGKKLFFVSFDASTGQAIFRTDLKDKNSQMVNIKLGHLFKNITNQKIIENLPKNQQEFLADTFKQDSANKEFAPNFDHPMPLHFSGLAESLGLMTVQSVQTAAQELQVNADEIKQIIANFPPQHQILSPESLIETITVLEKNAQNIEDKIKKLETQLREVEKNRPGFAPFLREDLKSAYRLARMAKHLKRFPSVIETYQKVGNGDELTIHKLDDEVLKLVKSPASYNLSNLLQFLGLSDPLALGDLSSFKQILIPKLLAQKNSLGRAQVLTTTLLSFLFVKLTA